MRYEHPKEYKGIRNQDRARLMVEENCLKCSEFMGAEHDFSECDLTGKKCPQPFKHSSIFFAKDLIQCFVKDSYAEDYCTSCGAGMRESEVSE